MSTSSCQENSFNPNKELTLDAFSDMRNSKYQLNHSQINRKLQRLAKTELSATAADRQTLRHYLDGGEYLWITYDGVDSRADTLLNYLSHVSRMGFSEQPFSVGQIRKDLERVRTLDFSKFEINDVYARLEFNLTKAYFRYCAGQRYGYVNPEFVLNRFDVRDSDSVRVRYNRVYDVRMEHPTDSFFHVAMRKIMPDSLGRFLQYVEPQGDMYRSLVAELRRTDISPAYRQKVLCNMERCRWQTKQKWEGEQKYVLVNIPAFRLYAVGGDSVLSMKIGCGTVKTKTPLLNSSLMRIDVNPKWVIPYSIIKKDIAHHAGDEGYFQRRHYYICERPSFKKVPTSSVTSSMLLSGKYSVVQEGGAGNSLGRIIFRFNNNFSVYLHDTSTPAFFSRDNRSVSHGCVRVEKPYQLALFLLGDDSDGVADKIKYSMETDLTNKQELPPEKRPKIDKSRLVNTVKVEPQVPLFITYYTLFPSQDGHLMEYPDVYGYDGVLYKSLQKYLQ